MLNISKITTRRTNNFDLTVVYILNSRYVYNTQTADEVI